ncbi:hypothetical protein EO087_05355 [Dyella sp. M7H15-1]|uniref:hypothetical protein n=1 Tax=Dyella sp. M7H15-1 TaxID=2501295 RepID=UPI001004DED5|nr:hypothetical protein [Dyella sp. M7H15-1]QAU23477.1 hypothetical protein EO087_05355 [Dyella sp. M7H15-1]
MNINFALLKAAPELAGVTWKDKHNLGDIVGDSFKCSYKGREYKLTKDVSGKWTAGRTDDNLGKLGTGIRDFFVRPSDQPKNASVLASLINGVERDHLARNQLPEQDRDVELLATHQEHEYYEDGHLYEKIKPGDLARAQFRVDLQNNELKGNQRWLALGHKKGL